MSRAFTLLQEAPLAIALEAVIVVQEVRVVGLVCKTFLPLEQLVETSRSNKDNLYILLELCEVVIKGARNKRSDRSGLLKGFEVLEKHVKKAEEVAKRCSGGGVRGKMSRSILARKVRKDITSVRSDVSSFCTANNLVLTNDVHVSTCIDLD